MNSLLIMAWMATALAERPTFTVGAVGGFDFGTKQPIAGIDLSLQPDQQRGFTVIGRLRGGVGIADLRPFGDVELGFAGVIPAETFVVRLGVIARTLVYVANYDLPLQVGQPSRDGLGAVGFFPVGMALAEVGYQRLDAERGPASWAIGLRMGAAPALKYGVCPVEEESQERDLCVGYSNGLLGGFSARLRFHEGVYLEALIGPSPTAVIGAAF